MIASFKQPRYSVVFAALIVAVGLVTLTDAQAGEPRVMRFHQLAPMSPQTTEVFKKLEQPISIDLRSTSIADTAAAIATATGVSITLAEGVADPAVRLNLNGVTIPANFVLMESMAAAGLGVKFTDTGVEIVKAPQDHVHPAEGDRVVFMRKAGGEPGEHPLPLRAPREVEGTRRFHIEKLGDDTSEKRRVTLSNEDGTISGTLEVEVLK